MNKFFKPKKLTIGDQVQKMKEIYPGFAFKLTKKNGVVWLGALQPSPLSIVYRVRIEYCIGASPKISVLSPKLKLAEGTRKLPHIYSRDSLCLYTPGKGEWHSGLYIAYTIVPWTQLWLLYYEGWLITKTWHGDGTEPNLEKST